MYKVIIKGAITTYRSYEAALAFAQKNSWLEAVTAKLVHPNGREQEIRVGS